MVIKHEEYLALGHFKGLDGVRAVAIIAVIWHHCVTVKALPILGRGFLGVDLFFVLSGFLIVTLLLREKATVGRISLKNFWARRFLRLMPVYFIMLAALAVIFATVKSGTPEAETFFNNWWVYAFYVSNWVHGDVVNMGVTWSLSTEEQFYLIWPLVEVFLAPIVGLGVLISFIGLNQIVNFGLMDSYLLSLFPDNAGSLEILEITYTPICLGVLLAHSLHHKNSFIWAHKLMGFAYAPVVFAALLFLSCNWLVEDISGAPRLVMQLLMAFFLGSLLLHPNSGTTRFLSLGFMTRMGMVSYGMYLFHLWIIGFIFKVTATIEGLSGSVFLFLPILLATYLIAECSFRFYEKPILNLRRYFRMDQPIVGQLTFWSIMSTMYEDKTVARLRGIFEKRKGEDDRTR